MKTFLRSAIAATAIAVSTLTAAPCSQAQTVPGTIYGAGTNPSAIAVNPVTNKVYVANADSDSVTVINTGTHATSTVAVGDHPSWVAINVENNTVYVGILGGKVYVIDGATDTVSNITKAGGAGAMAVNPLVDTAFVARYSGDGTIDVIVGEDFQVTSSTRSHGPVALALNPMTNWLYVAHQLSGDVVAMDMTTPQAYPPIKCPDGSGGFRAQPPAAGTPDTWNIPCINMPGNPVAVAVNPLTNMIYAITDNPTWQLAVINGDDSTFTALSLPGSYGAPKTIAANPVTNMVWAAFSGAVVKIDGATNALTVFPAGSGSGGPAAIAIEVFRNMVYVANTDGTLLAIDGANHTTEVVAAMPGAKAVAVNELTRQVYVLGTNGVREVSGAPGSAGTNKSTGMSATITPLPSNIGGASGTLSLSATSAWPPPLDSVRKVFYRMDAGTGPWKEATRTGPGTWSVSYSGLAPGPHTLFAFPTNGMEAPSINTDLAQVPILGNLTSYAFTVPSANSRDLAVTQVSDANPGVTGKDITYTVTVTNNGPGSASGIILTDDPRGTASASFVWASAGCSVSMASGSPLVTCNVGTLAEGASVQVKVVLRPSAAGSLSNNVSVRGGQPDPVSSNDFGAVTMTVNASAAGVPVVRYRLYSPVTQEHLFTTSQNEYDTLGAQSGTWNKEGEAGKVLNNPGSFNGVAAMPYYRLYNKQTRWHHWTTDANEYYTLAQYAEWGAEGVDGYILPPGAAGTIPLYRLVYPDGRGLHHWTIDKAEYDSLIRDYGWQGEGGSGYVIQ